MTVSQIAGSLLLLIGEREALPVRAIPYVTCWVLKPHDLASQLGRQTGAPFDWLRNTNAFHLVGGKPRSVLPAEWHRVVGSFEALEARIRRETPYEQPGADPEGNERWRESAVEQLPAGVFVWRDDFERDFFGDLRRRFAPDCGTAGEKLTYSPMGIAGVRASIFEGFEPDDERGALSSSLARFRDKPEPVSFSALTELPQSERRKALDAAGLRHVSAAPAPITPLQGGGFTRRRPIQQARWQVWRFIPGCALWRAVCLSLDIEPSDELAEDLQRGPRYSSLPSDFWDRLMVCQANVRMAGPIQPQELYVGAANSPHVPVLLSQVASFLGAAEFSIPDAMRALAPTAEATNADTRTATEPSAIAEQDKPAPLGTPAMADALDGIAGKDAAKWRRTLGEPPKWMVTARVEAGMRGTRPATWNPVLLVAVMLERTMANEGQARQLFRTRPELAAWAEVWRERESRAAWLFKDK